MNTRFPARSTYLIICFFLVISGLPPAAQACVCDYFLNPLQALEYSDAVFTGVVTAVTPDSCEYEWEVEFAVTRAWKGVSDCTFTILDDPFSSCSPGIWLGAEVLIFAVMYSSGSDGCRAGLRTNICLGSTRLGSDPEYAQWQIEELQKVGMATVAEWGQRGSGDGEFDDPSGIAIDAAGNVYVADTHNHRIQKFTQDGTFLHKWGTEGSGNGEFSYPSELAVDESGNVLVADSGNHRIQKFDANGTFLIEWGTYGSGDGEFINPFAVTVDAVGGVYVLDNLYDVRGIQKFTNDGVFEAQWPDSSVFKEPSDLAAAPDGTIHVTAVADDPQDDDYYVFSFTADGTYINKWGKPCTTDEPLPQPAVCIDIGATGEVYVGLSRGDTIIEGYWGPGLARYWGVGGPGAYLETQGAVGVACGTDGRAYITGRFDAVKVYGDRGTLVAVEPPGPGTVKMELTAYPNPFNPVTTIYYRTEARGAVTLTIHDVRGRTVRELLNRAETQGEHWLTWDGRDKRGSAVPSGVYFVRLETMEGVATRKITLIK